MGPNTQVAFVLPTHNAQELFRISSEEAKSILVEGYRFSINGHVYFYHKSIDWNREQSPGVSEIWNYIVDLELKSNGHDAKKHCYLELGADDEDVTIFGDISKFDLVFQKSIILPDIETVSHRTLNTYEHMMEAA